jgi:hypothetical protein
VFVNVPGPVLPVIRQVERLPGVASAAATVGLNANPVVNGEVNDGWLTNGLTGSLDGDGFRQDRLTVAGGQAAPARRHRRDRAHGRAGPVLPYRASAAT